MRAAVTTRTMAPVVRTQSQSGPIKIGARAEESATRCARDHLFVCPVEDEVEAPIRVKHFKRNVGAELLPLLTTTRKAEATAGHGTACIVKARRMPAGDLLDPL